MKKSACLVLILFAVILVATPLLLFPGAEFDGADDLAGEEALAIRPDYEPWLDNIFALPENMESLLFTLQAAAGSGFIGFYLGKMSTRRQFGTKKA